MGGGGWGAQGFPSPELVLTSLAVGAKVKFQPTRSVSGTGKPADSTATCELSQRLILKWILGYVLHVSGHGWVAVSVPKTFWGGIKLCAGRSYFFVA